MFFLARPTRARSLAIASALGGIGISASLFTQIAPVFHSDSGSALVASHHAAEVLVTITYLALWVCALLLIYQLHRCARSSWIFQTALATLTVEVLLHAGESRSFGVFSGRAIIALKSIGAVSAAATAIGLPFYLRDLQKVAKALELGKVHEGRLAVATETSPDAVFMLEAVRDPSGAILDFRFTFLNKNAEELLGAHRKALLGKHLGACYPALREAGRISQYAAVVESGVPLRLEAPSPVVTLNGAPALCRFHARRLQDGVLVTCEDLTSMRLARQELTRALALNKAIVVSSPFSIIVTDVSGTITSVNPAAERMLLTTSSSLVGKSILRLHDPQEILARAAELERELGRPVAADFDVFTVGSITGTGEEREWIYLRENGTRFPVQLTTSAVEDESGAIIGFMAVSFDLSDRKATDEHIYHLVHHDSLTGLPSRALFREQLNSAIERARRFDLIFGVLLIDLDHFKRVNDTFGHQAGDVVLAEIALRLSGTIGKSDTVARFGGDEFVILLPELRSREDLAEVTRKIAEALKPPVRFHHDGLMVTASIGVSVYPDGLDADELIRNADVAMYRQKSSGGDGIVTFTKDLGLEIQHRVTMESAMRSALQKNEFFLVYQPQVSMETGEITGVEALIRWQSSQLGLVMPMNFIPMAEETGLIVSIGAWALEKACEDVAKLQEQLGHKLTIAVNVSPRQLHQEGFQRTLEDALRLSGLEAAQLEIEITENLLMRDSEESLQIIENMQALGVTTAIDDFGTGFSNMSYITRFRVDRLKIDRSFVSKCVDDENSLAVTKAIIALAHSLKMRVVAEGVETIEQALMLRDLRCDYGQGYLYSRPLTFEHLLGFAASRERRTTSNGPFTST